MTTTEHAIGPPLLLDAEQAAALAGVSRSHWWSLHSAALVPFPVKLGRATRWRRREIEAWVDAGCPPRHEWLAMQEGPGETQAETVPTRERPGLVK